MQGATIDVESFCETESFEVLKSVPRYLLIDNNELRALAFKKHTAQFISAKLDHEVNADSLGKKHAMVFVGSEYFEANKHRFMAYKNEIVVIDDSRDYIDWLKCAYYGDEVGCKRFNAKPKAEEKKRNFLQRLVYLFRGE